MIRFIFYNLLFCFVLGPLSARAQQQTSPSDPSFNFKDGVYFTLQDYKENQPSALFSQFCDKNGKPVLDFELNTVLYYKTDAAEIKNIRTENIFGYGSKGDFYIKINYNGIYFARLVVIGSMSHFVCEVQNVRYGGYGYNGMGNMTSYVLMQFLFDYDTGNISSFEQDVFTTYLQRDEELYTEYNALPKKKKRDLMFLYLRKYNEKHPILFPQ